MKRFTLFTLCAMAAPAFAGEDAKVLPQSIFRAREVFVFTDSITRKFDNDGAFTGGLVDQMSANVNASSFTAASPELASLVNALNGVSSGMGDNLLYGQVVANTAIISQKFVTAVEYGITEKLSLGIIIPVTRYETGTLRMGAEVQSLANDILASGAANGLPASAQDALRNFDANLPLLQAGLAANAQAKMVTELESKGYEVPQQREFTGLGDIEIGGKYQYFKNDMIMAAVKAGVRVPTTTHRADQTKIFDQNTGDGQTDLGVMLLQTIEPVYGLTFGGSAQFTYQIADGEDRYVNPIGTTGLPNLTVAGNRQLVHRDLGEKLDGEAYVLYEFYKKAFGVSATYQYEFKAQDSYNGPAGFDYNPLMKDTNTVSHRMEFALSANSFPWFRAKQFPVPVEAEVAYNMALGGKNIPDVNYWRFTMKVYF